MPIPISPPTRLTVRWARLAGRFATDCVGTTAVEFGLVATPFFLMMMGIMTIGLQYLTSHSLEMGLDAASRKVMTGEAQKAGLTVGGFRQLVCDGAGTYIACDTHLVVHIKSGTKFADLAPAVTCVTNGALTPASGSTGDLVRARAGNASAAVQVTACYEWDMGAGLWQSIRNLLSPTPPVEGKTVLSATTAFRSEPFE